MVAGPLGLGAKVTQRFEQTLHVRDPWRVSDHAGLRAQDGRGHQLQHGVLRTRARHAATEWHATFDQEGQPWLDWRTSGIQPRLLHLEWSEAVAGRRTSCAVKRERRQTAFR